MELLPQDQIVFNKMLEVIKKTYELFGFMPIETPAVEFTEILLTKSGGETEKQIWGIQKGDGSRELSLHFDLTVPLARYVAQRHEELTFPFRRYQMQKVWRGERNQKGRFREFYQCDIDVIGSTNVLIDAEIPSVIFEAFKNLGFPNIMIRINNRKILNGFLVYLNCSDKSKDILRIVDKIDKQGKEKVAEELEGLGITGDSVTKILDFIEIKGNNEEVINKLRSLKVPLPLFAEGLAELETVAKAIEVFGVPRENFKLDLSIARGLDYYTGTVYETLLKDYPEIGSVCSGGRFDDLAEYYTDKKLPGVGISIGLTRLFFKLKEAGLIKSKEGVPSKVLVANMGKEFVNENIMAATELRKNGINAEVYFESEKISKQFKYADRLGIPFVVIIGEVEARKKAVTLKSMDTGEQNIMGIDDVIKLIQK
jgi:histidyl-tRNA synthetase